MMVDKMILREPKPSRKKKEDRPTGDFYQTPKGLTWKLLETGELNDCKTILEPACGQCAISNILKEKGFEVEERDLIYGNDFLTEDYTNKKYDAIVTNPPFSLWNEFVEKAKSIDCKKIIMIGRTNYFGSHSRNINGIWNNLSDVYIFDRQVAYDREFRKDGKMFCGCLITCWFVWKKEYVDLPKIHLIDVQDLIIKKGK